MNEQRNPYRRDTEGAPISEGEIASSQRVSEDSLPAHAVVADGESADARTAPSASYSPPRVHASGQPVVRNETPLLITVFTIGIAAIAVVLFFVSQALGNLSTVEWSLPKPPTSEPERGAPNPNATQGMGEGTYEVPTDAWLHPGYKAGVTEWTASGSYVGVSQDKSTIVLDKLSNGTEFVGYDVKTGTEKWRKSFKGAADLSCLDVWNGIAYCSSNYDATKAIFASIDLATGELTQPGNIDKEGFRSHFIGHWQGYSYWTLEFDSRSSQVGPWQPDGLIAIKDQMLQWEVDIAPDTECIVGDGGIGCHDQSHKKVELFNASTGEFVAEVADVPSVDWYRDGFTIVDWGSEERETRYYSWTGERKEEPSAVPFPHLPYQDQELLVSITPARDRVRNPVFVNPQGDSLVESTYATGGHVYKDLSTNQVIATKNNRVEVSGDEKGTVYLLIDRALGAFRFIDENGKEIFFEEYGQKESLGAHHGILVHHSVESVTVYAPQG